MRTCEKCGVDVYGSSAICPLCQNGLAGTPCPQEDIFPVPALDIQAARERNFLVALAVGSASAVVVCIALNFMVSARHMWSLFVAGGVVTFWLCWFLTNSKRKTIPRSVVWETTVFSVIAVLWDLGTGFRGWSVDYVLPILMAFSVLALSTLLGAGIVTDGSIIFYRFLLGVFGVVPVILMLTQVVTIVIPSAICAAVCALSLIQTFGFELSKLVPELKRRLHI